MRATEPAEIPKTTSDPVAAWRAWFDAWEPRAALAWERAMRESWLVEPIAALITGIAHAKRLADETRRRALRACGLATREDHERVLFLLQRMESRLFDLEDGTRR
jgi:hypothetical protein